MFSNPFQVDLRALAAMRICVGLLILTDLTIRAPDLGWFMSEWGVLDTAASRLHADEWRFSLYWLSSSFYWTCFLFVCAALAAALLVFGIRTRFVTVVSFLLLASLHNRNPLLLQGGDNLLLLLTFWGMMLPWGARWSIDAVMSERRALADRLVGFPAAAILLQVVSVYFFSAFLKNGSEWTVDGTAIYYALHHDQYVNLLGPYWRDWHGLTVPLTHYVWWLELLGPLLALSPLWNTAGRSIAAFCLITLELGFLSSLNVGLFPFISITSLLILLPGPVWDALERRARPRGVVPVTLYFDRDCGFCEKACRVIRAWFAPHAQIRPAQDVPEVGALLEREFSWVIEVAGERHLRTAGLVAVIRAGGRWPWLAAPFAALPVLCDRVYGFVGRHRSAFGRATAVLMPWRDAPPAPGRFAHTALVFFTGVVLVWNVLTLPPLGAWAASRPMINIDAARQNLGPVIRLFRLDQIWNMFAPRPALNDGWFMMAGISPTGQLLDVLQHRIGVPDARKPAHFVPEQAPNDRWRKYYSRLLEPEFGGELGRYAGAQCRAWNQRAAQDAGWPVLEAFNIYYIEERTPPMGQVGTLSFHLVWRHHCLDVNKLDQDRVQRALLAAEASSPGTEIVDQ